MSKTLFSNKSIQDLDGIWKYTRQEWSEKQADKYYQMLISTCKAINVATIGRYRKYNEILPELFGKSAGNHIIFFRKGTSDTIEIIRILHKRMDIKNRLLD